MSTDLEISTGQQFRIERELKHREDGRVVLVRESQTLQRYIYREFTGSPAAYRAMLALDSPYLPHILAVEERDGTVRVLEEYIQGDSLEDILSVGELPEEQARKILLELCFALLLLHGVGIVHRDIKPENVILRSDNAVLIDFDISRITDPKQSTDTQIMGTNGYAAPEQYGVCQTDQRADIYALGVLANELLTRRHPSVTLAEGALRPIIEKCIAVNVDQRYASVAELVEALSGISPELTPLPRRRRRGLRLAAAALCCLLAAGAGLAAGRASLRWWVNTESAVSVQESVLAVSDTPWDGSSSTYTTHFTYDLDGDGQEEGYIFGIYFIGIPVKGVLNDQCTLSAGATRTLELSPCVWQENADGSPGEAVPEFAPLLGDSDITLWRMTSLDSPAPEVVAIGGTWGGIRVTYQIDDHEGRWMYRTAATLGGETLTAVSTTELILQ